jgi:hypothetical protein
VADSGDYEFYDGPGFHPKLGDQLNSFTRTEIAAWRQAMQAVAERERQKKERSEQENAGSARERGGRKTGHQGSQRACGSTGRGRITTAAAVRS